MARRPVRQDPAGDQPGHRGGDRQVAHAGTADLDEALEAAAAGFAWKKVSAFERSKLMRKAADLLRSRADAIAALMTLEQGKPLPEARMEVMAGADVIDWFAEEARRAYGRVIPARAEGVYQLVVKEPVGPVAAFTPVELPDQPGGAQALGRRSPPAARSSSRRRRRRRPRRPS